MSDPFIAEIRIFAGNFAPHGWAFCNGQLLPIAQNTALFSLIGTTYGGDGRTTTGLPNLQGRVPMHPGRGPGLADKRLGQKGGVTTVTLTEAQMPQHTHTLQATEEEVDRRTPKERFLAEEEQVYGPAVNLGNMADGALTANGGSGPHNNMQPYLVVNFIIALVGIYPIYMNINGQVLDCISRKDYKDEPVSLISGKE
ncbi:MAG: phage tail protein [bacterium]